MVEDYKHKTKSDKEGLRGINKKLSPILSPDLPLHIKNILWQKSTFI
jgi:hypothetical protein